MTNLTLIQPQAVNFRTAQSVDWLDSFPIIGRAGAGGVVPGTGNVGTGSLVLSGVAAGTQRGAHVCTVTGIKGGQTYLSVADPDGDVTGQGVVGLPLTAGGLALTVNQGATPFSVGDTFAVGVLTVPLDITGIVFRLAAMLNTGSRTIVLAAASAYDDGSVPTMGAGTVDGALGMQLRQAAMARCAVGDFPYAVTGTDPDTGLTVPVFLGTIRHRTIPSFKD
ncbi:hypothetical protein [Methylobacterium fujisawaense]|uniref:hypothetical protein n=1 Tax=Methylobacterium fujisawaense TaxID=107400 RepID=UPI00313BC217